MFKTQLLETSVVLQAPNVVFISSHSMTTSDTLSPSISALTVQVAVNPSVYVVLSDSGEVSTTMSGPVVVRDSGRTKSKVGARKLTNNCYWLNWFTG